MVKTINETVVPLKTNKTNKNNKKKTIASRATRRSTRITKKPERYSPVPSDSGRFSDDYKSSEHNTTHSWSDATSIDSANSISSTSSQSKQNGGLANAVSTAFENMDLESQGSNNKSDSMASFLTSSNDDSIDNSSSSYNPSNSGNSDGSSADNESESSADS